MASSGRISLGLEKLLVTSQGEFQLQKQGGPCILRGPLRHHLMKGSVTSLNKDNTKLDGLNRIVCEYEIIDPLSIRRVRRRPTQREVAEWRSGPRKQEHVTEILVPISNSQLQTLRQSSDALVPPPALNDYALIYPNTYLIELHLIVSQSLLTIL